MAPSCWVEKVSTTRGKVYYFNVRTGESRWVRPETPIPDAAVDRQVDTCLRMCAGMCIDMCLVMCLGMCVEMREDNDDQWADRPATYVSQSGMSASQVCEPISYASQSGMSQVCELVRYESGMRASQV